MQCVKCKSYGTYCINNLYKCKHEYCNSCYYDLIYKQKTKCIVCSSVCTKYSDFLTVTALKEMVYAYCNFPYIGTKEKMCKKILETLGLSMVELYDMVINKI